jgi:hypothetical protein
MKKTTIPAIFKEDIKKLLESIGEFEPIVNGDRICRVCSKIITVDNIQLIIPRAGKLFDFVCDSPVCIEEYNRKNN